MVQTNYWFEKSEYEARLARVQTVLIEKKQDALLAFMPETVTYLTGFFTRAYTSFQFAIVPAAGEPTLICRDVEEYYLDSTCIFPNRVMWNDSDDPAAVAVGAIRSRLGARAPACGRNAAWPLSVARYEGLKAGCRTRHGATKAASLPKCASSSHRRRSPASAVRRRLRKRA